MNSAANEQTLYNSLYGAGSYEAYGNTYIVWGTDWATTSSGLIVISATFTDRIIKFPVEQGAGFTAFVGLLMDGKDGELECVDVTNVAQFSNALNPYTLVSPAGSITMLLEGNKTNYARKTEGRRVGTFASYTAFALGGGGTVL